jgi:microcystin-dependent protein
MAKIRRNLGIPAGVVFQSAAISAPHGYLFCDGSEVLKTDYPELYSSIGDTYGTPTGGSTFFCLPDYRGKFLRGYDGSAGNDPDKASRAAMKTGAVSGNNIGSVQTDSLQGHFHSKQTSTSTTNGGAVPIIVDKESGVYDNGTVNDTVLGPVSDGTNGTPRTSSETRPKNVSVNYIIKY